MPRSAAGILFCSSSDSRPIKPACRSGRRHSSIMIRFARQRDKNRERIVVTCIQPEVALGERLWKQLAGVHPDNGTENQRSGGLRPPILLSKRRSIERSIGKALRRSGVRCSPYRILQQSDAVTYSFLRDFCRFLRTYWIL